MVPPPLVRAFFNSTPPALANGESAPLQADSSGNLKISNAAMGSTTDAAQDDSSSAGSVVAFLKGLMKSLGKQCDTKLQDGDTAGTLLAHVKGINEAANATTPVNVTMNGSASGTLSKHRKTSTNDTNPTVVKAAAGQVYLTAIGNCSATGIYVKFYDTASAPTVGTTPIVWSVFVAAGQTVVIPLENGLPFTSGIAYGITQSKTDAGTAAPAADDVTVNIAYV